MDLIDDLATLETVLALSIIGWIGGMESAHFFLRPAVAQMESPVRLRLMHDALGRLFKAVLVASLLTLSSGVSMLGRVAKRVVQPVAFAITADFAGTAIFFAHGIFAAVVFEPVAFAFIVLLLVSTAAFAEAHQ